MKILSLVFLTLFLNACTSSTHKSTNEAVMLADFSQTESGLRFKDMKVGSGESPKKGTKVTVHYTRWLVGGPKDGEKFDSSVDRGQPFQFTVGVGQVIKGWDEGVVSMKKGGKRILVIPPDLGYGARGAGSAIPPNSTLKFEVELLDF